MKVVPEPWRSMTDAQLAAMKESDARQMLAAVSTPELVQLRADVRAFRTSELIVMLSRPEEIAKKAVPPDSKDVRIPPQYDHEDEMLIIAAATIVIADEIDRRVPRP